ncbi:Hypothetical predicted protein [Olea europaea subsp. europaea]|uniref:Protein TIFY n=2 Tax=Olea europaea subsp. europaea TaxID=158383 RepID=A0A8S0V961_OLEEU|nr:Hypothetical predicted protein [Olea europaea subsp. europaea]
MERVRMGLSSKDSVAVIKEEIVQDCKDSGFTNSSGVQLLLSNEETTLPHFASSKSEQHQTLSEMKSDPLASPGVVAKSAADLFDASQKQRSGNIQQHSVLPSMTNRFYKTHFMGSGQKFEDATKKQQFLCEIPPTASVFGTTKQWFHSKASAVPAQLTIFYAGKVNVFDEISPEKAQAIILLAGNGCVSSNMAQPRLSVDTLTSKVAAADGALVNQSMNVTRCSVLSSPVSVSSHPIDQSRSTPASNNEDVKVSNSLGFSANIVSEAEPPRRVTSLGSIAATEIISSAAPQARKASLARFFEKRKERAMNSAPYNLCKKVADADRATPESGDFGYSATSDVPGSISVSTFKESSTEI